MGTGDALCRLNGECAS